MKVVNKNLVDGTFPHKGTGCYRIRDYHTGAISWVPVEGTILAESVLATCSYVPAELLEAESLGQCRAEPSLIPGHLLARTRGFVTLARDWPADRTGGRAGPLRRVPAGSRVCLADPGDAHTHATWWVVAPGDC